MPSMSITMSGHKRIRRDLEKSDSVIRAKAFKFLRDQSIDIERIAKKEAPVDTAQLQTSIRPELSARNLGITVNPNTKYAYYAHEGRKPGKMPPVEMVESWARRKGLDPFLVARSIANKGTKGKKFMDIAYDKQKPKFNREAKVLLNDIVRAI